MCTQCMQCSGLMFTTMSTAVKVKSLFKTPKRSRRRVASVTCQSIKKTKRKQVNLIVDASEAPGRPVYPPDCPGGFTGFRLENKEIMGMDHVVHAEYRGHTRHCSSSYISTPLKMHQPHFYYCCFMYQIPSLRIKQKHSLLPMPECFI